MEERRDEGRAADHIDVIVSRRRARITSHGFCDRIHVKRVVRALLKQARACPRCCLRLVGCPADRLAQPISAADLERWCSDACDAIVAVDPRDDQVCGLCFGLLQLDSGVSVPELNLVVERQSKKKKKKSLGEREMTFGGYQSLGTGVTSAMVDEGFFVEGANFTLHVHLPLAVALREISCVHWLEHTFGTDGLSFNHVAQTDYYGVKRALKALVSGTMAAALNSRPVKEEEAGAFEFEFHMQAPELSSREAEAHALLSERARSDGKSRKRKRGGLKQEFGERCPQIVAKAAAALGPRDFKEAFPIDPQASEWRVAAPGSALVRYSRYPVYVCGRYLKFSRELSQTAWVVDQERIGESSVEEVIVAALGEDARADEWKMVAAGREDLDVRMLGTGRPFVVEARNCVRGRVPLRDALEPERLGAILAGRVGLRDVHATTKKALDILREGAEEKEKTYDALVWLSRPFTDADVDKIGRTRDLVTRQNTPLRVVHRRTAMVRERTIFEMKLRRCEGRGPHFAMLELRTQAGTYIKEFVHGDMGRTSPSVASLLGCDADILELDVMGVEMDFKPPVC